MNETFAAALRRAAASTRAGDLAEVTQTIQRALAPLDNLPRVAAGQILQRQESSRAGEAAGSVPRVSSFPPASRLRMPLGDTLRALRQGGLKTRALTPLTGVGMPTARASTPPPIPTGARFMTRSFSCAAGTRSYKLYVPASIGNRPRALVVMLHGCSQDPDDFAAGTNMNNVAEANGLLVIYPQQSNTANASACWNWFDPAHQERDAGEPSILAGITRKIMSEFGLTRDQVFVAGLSAGGAMAAVMAEVYPDIYAAAGIHSGLRYGCANDVISAFAAMRGDASQPSRSSGRRPSLSGSVRAIVFQGTADQTVHPCNAEGIVAAAGPEAGTTVRREAGSSAGRTYNRMVVTNTDGESKMECWLIDGAGHAWAGGHPAGSYADPLGPSASAEMVRFFLEQPAAATTKSSPRR